jgi:acetyltransferase-like isoleucine patch superfamily enzyme
MVEFLRIPFSDLPDHFFSSNMPGKRFSPGSELWLEDESDLFSDQLSLKIVSKVPKGPPTLVRISKVTKTLNVKLNTYGSSLGFGTGCQGNWDVRLWPGSDLSVGDGTTSNSTRVIVDNNCGISIGRDCMMSDNVLLECGDKHAIFSLTDDMQINGAVSVISIGDHCWLGRDSAVIASSKHLEFGSGSILGAKSVLTSSADRFSLAAGCPARVIKENVSWSRQKQVSSSQIQQIVSSINSLGGHDEQ